MAQSCLKATAKNRAHIREIAVSGPLCDWWKRSVRNPNHIVLEVPMDQSLLTDILLFEQTVMLTNYDPNNEMAVLIKHPDYYALMVAIFDAFWNTLRSVEQLNEERAN